MGSLFSSLVLESLILISVIINRCSVTPKPPSSIDSLTDEELYDLIEKRDKNNVVRPSNHWNSLIADTVWRISSDAVVKSTYSPTEAFIMSHISSHTSIPIPKVRRVLPEEPLIRNASSGGSSWTTSMVMCSRVPGKQYPPGGDSAQCGPYVATFANYRRRLYPTRMCLVHSMLLESRICATVTTSRRMALAPSIPIPRWQHF